MMLALCFAGGCAAPEEEVFSIDEIATEEIYTDETADYAADWIYLKEQLGRILEVERTGAIVPWENPETGRGGTVKITRTYKLGKKTACRFFLRTLEDEEKRVSLRGSACRESPKVWQLIDPGKVAEILERSSKARALRGVAPSGKASAEAIVSSDLADLGSSDQRHLQDRLPYVLEYGITRMQHRWSNAVTGSKGVFSMRSTFYKNPRTPCRAFEVVRKGMEGGRDWVIIDTVCRDRRGNWLAGDGRPPEERKAFLDAVYRNCNEAAAEDSWAEEALAISVGRPDFAKVDLVFIIDVTGSMKDELEILRPQILNLVHALGRRGTSLTLGVVAFKDRGDAPYLTKVFDLAPMTGERIPELEAFLATLEAKDGGGRSEPIHIALQVAVGLPWRPDALGRMVLITDSRDLSNKMPAAFNEARRFNREAPRGAGQRQVLSVFTGQSLNDRYYHRALTEAGGGGIALKVADTEACVLASLGAAGRD